jgi:hypothetical protein
MPAVIANDYGETEFGGGSDSCTLGSADGGAVDSMPLYSGLAR